VAKKNVILNHSVKNISVHPKAQKKFRWIQLRAITISRITNDRFAAPSCGISCSRGIVVRVFWTTSKNLRGHGDWCNHMMFCIIANKIKPSTIACCLIFSFEFQKFTPCKYHAVPIAIAALACIGLLDTLEKRIPPTRNHVKNHNYFYVSQFTFALKLLF